MCYQEVVSGAGGLPKRSMSVTGKGGERREKDQDPACRKTVGGLFHRPGPDRNLRGRPSRTGGGILFALEIPLSQDPEEARHVPRWGDWDASSIAADRRR